MKLKHAVLATIASLGLSASTFAATIAQWDFNSNPGDANTATGITTPAIGSGTIATTGGVTTPGFNSGAGSSDPNTTDDSGFQTETYATQSTGSGTRGIRINAGTSGFEDISVTFDLRTSNTSSRWYQLNYSTDGTTFTPFGSPTRLGTIANAGDTWFNGNTVDLSSIPGLDNNPLAAFQIVSVFSGVAFTEANSSTNYGANSAYEVARNTTSNYGGGTWRFDYVTISGSAIPEPASLGLLALGGLTLLRRRRQA